MKLSAKKLGGKKKATAKATVRKQQHKRPDFDSPEFFMALTSHFYAAKREALGRE